MGYGLLSHLPISNSVRVWLVRRHTTTCKLYSIAVICVLGTILLSLSQMINVHSTMSPPVMHHWSVHFLSEDKVDSFYGNSTNGTYNSNETKIIWTHPELNILQKEPFHFIESFKNPCWYEPLYTTNVYQNNKYSLLSPHIRNTMVKLMTEWNLRLVSESQPRRLRCLPYFFIIGQPKCGSTDLFRRILQHPDVVSPPIKELHWWSRNRMGKRLNYTDIIPFSDYIDIFDDAAIKIERRGVGSNNQIVTGEASVSVMWEHDDWYHLPENVGHTEPLYTNADYLKHFMPNLKILVILRNPSDRLWSDYLYFNPTANKSLEDFHNRVNFSVRLYENCFQNHSIRHCLYNNTIGMASQVRLRIGVYSVYLKDWLKEYPRKQVLVLTLNEYSSKLMKTMTKVFSFLKLRPLTKEQAFAMKKMRRQNKRKYKDKRLGAMLEKTKDLLDNFYGKFDDELRQLVGHDITWGEGNVRNKTAGRRQTLTADSYNITMIDDYE